MGKVVTEMSMSLDGFIAGPGDDISKLHAWFSIGDTEFALKNTDMVIKVSAASARLIRERYEQIGAGVEGRRTFDLSGAWGGEYPLGVPAFVVTHHPPQEWVNKPGSPFTFVTDGVASAVAQAKQAAGDKTVAVGAANVVQQCLKAGLLDEIQIHLVPILLGDGIRFFDHLGSQPIELETTSVVEGTGVTHLTYHVVK